MRKLLSLTLLLALLLCGCAPTQEAPPQPEDTLQVHFIDVGQADCILLECGSEYMLVDGGNTADSSLVVSYLQKQGVQELKAVVGTHPHEDHVGGLAGVLAVFPTAAVYSPTRTYSSKCFDDFAHYADQQGLELTIPTPGDKWTLGTATITVLGPLTSYADVNDTSIVLMVQFGQTRFLLTGDMEREAETDLLESGADLKADVLKVGHHGSYSSTGYLFLRTVAPKYAVISCGRGNSYGHPHEEPLSRLRDAEVTVYRTDELATVIATSDGTDITFTWERTGATPGNPTPESAEFYIGNYNSKVFHKPTCQSLPAEWNRVIFDTYEDAIAADYRPCSRCIN